MTVYQRAVLQLLIAIVKLMLNHDGAAEAGAYGALGYAQGHLEMEGSPR